MTGFQIDVSDALRAASELGIAASKAVGAIEPVMKKAAQNIKTNMQSEFSRRKHFKQIAGDVSYDRLLGFSGIGYEIGPTPDGDAGSLAGIAVDGGANGGGGTVEIEDALRAEEPALIAEIEKALGRLL